MESNQTTCFGESKSHPVTSSDDKDIYSHVTSLSWSDHASPLKTLYPTEQISIIFKKEKSHFKSLECHILVL